MTRDDDGTMEHPVAMVTDGLQSADSARPPDQLHYEPGRRWKARSFSRRMVVAAVVCICVIVAMRIGPDALRRFELNRLQNRCLDYRSGNEPALIAPAGDCGIRIHVPPAWATFYSIVSPPGLRSDGTLFLGRLHTPEGHERLIAVDLDASGNRIEPVARMFEPGSMMRTPVEMTTTCFNKATLVYNASAAIEQGVRDPQDASHFTARYTVDGKAGIIDGWITGDNTIIIETRDE